MKITYHIPTEQFGFVEVEQDVHSAEVNDTLGAYYKAKVKVMGGVGLEPSEWCKVMDKYMEGGSMESNEYERMSMEQQRVIQEIKKCFKRINRHNQE